jgi:hypothetical protein
MLLDRGQATLIEVPPSRAAQLKKGGRMQWDRNRQAFTAPASLGLLEYLSALFPLPGPYAEVMRRLQRNREAAERERTKEAPEPMCSYPVKRRLYAHQVRAANMALLTFGILEAGDEDKGE